MGFKEKVKTALFPQTSYLLLHILFQQRVTTLPQAGNPRNQPHLFPLLITSVLAAMEPYSYSV